MVAWAGARRGWILGLDVMCTLTCRASSVPSASEGSATPALLVMLAATTSTATMPLRASATRTCSHPVLWPPLGMYDLLLGRPPCASHLGTILCPPGTWGPCPPACRCLWAGTAFPCCCCWFLRGPGRGSSSSTQRGVPGRSQARAPLPQACSPGPSLALRASPRTLPGREG